MDKGRNVWWDFPKWADEFENGVDNYLDKAFATEAQGDQIRCPCSKCMYRYWLRRNVVREHVICKGFIPRLEKESDLRVNMDSSQHDYRSGTHFNDDIDELLQQTFREGPNEEAQKFYKLVEEGQQELYPGCKNFSQLSFTIRLFLFKCDHKLSNAAFSDLLKLIRDMHPEAKLPSSFNQAKNALKVLGLDYTKIDACPNDCMLYWDEYADATCCHICKSSRWKSNNEDGINKKCSQIPAKILRYFPVKKRLQRLFMCSETASYMTWHANGRPIDGLLRHPADGEAWKDFDLLYPTFAKDPRNVRLGLASDGFSPFNNLSISHSTWPVILINYNLPPWMYMKPEFFMLALLIPGPFSPGNEIDVYMQPLLKDLKSLWEFGLDTYDAASNQMFSMRVALHSTISDFPGYAMLSGWSTKGKMACPCCHYETCATSLPYSGKICYMDHRRFLDKDHTWRHNKRQFHGKIEDREALVRLSGTEIAQLLCDFKNDFGKKKKKKKNKDQNPWRKISSLFDLPYWRDNKYRHNLDAMHIEKNVFDNLTMTLLNISGKTKDHIKAREDLVELNIMPELHPKEGKDGKIEIPKALFTMSADEKRAFCLVMKNARLPQGYASNIKRCVQVGDLKMSGYKSHDAHFMMHYLLPVAASITLHEDVATPVIRLCNFFKSLWCKVLDPQDLDHLQREIAETLCEFEKIFPPSFFDIMVHLPIHLVEEIKLGGPVASRCMYAIERYLRKLKSHVRNKARPEGSMAEGFLTDECVTFCSRYLNHGSKPERGQPNNVREPHSMFPRIGYALKGKGRTKKNERFGFKIDLVTWNQVHRYVLFNCDCDEIERYINEHKVSLSTRNKRKWDTLHNHNKDFINWFREKVEYELQQGHEVLGHIKSLSVGPSHLARRYSGYAINGYSFHTIKRDANCVTDNSGVTLTALTPSFASSKDRNPVVGDVTYYGSIQDIIEINYNGDFSFVLFRCIWYYAERDHNGLARVNQSKFISKEEPFILASQANQAFYVEDPTKKGWYFAIKNRPKDYVDGVLKVEKLIGKT